MHTFLPRQTIPYLQRHQDRPWLIPLYTHTPKCTWRDTCKLNATSAMASPASATNTCTQLLLLLMSLLLLAHRGNCRAVFSSLSFESQGEAEAFEDALLRQACFNVSSSWGREACVSRLDTARGGAGSGPVPVLRSALRDTLGEAVSAVGAVAGLASLSNHAREEMAVRDCVELLGYSVDELGWALNAMAEPDDLDPEPGSSRSGAAAHRSEEDLHAWLSAALSNQDTCIEGFHGTDGRLLRRVEAAVAQLTQLVSNLLAMHKRLRSITPLHHAPPRNNGTSGSGADSELPPWVMDVDGGGEEQELVRAHAAGRKATRVDVVVAQDGSGRYRTVSEAVARAPNHSRRRYVIYVKRGVYHENVEVKKKKTNIVIVGEGMGETVISGSRSLSGGWSTFRSATFAVSGAGFIARDLTFRNTAGPAAHQAVALRVDSDRSAFFRVAVEGHQDTLYAHSLRQFYRDCRVAGTVDFVFGNGIAVIQRSTIATLPLAPGQVGSVTAQGRKDPNQNTGFSFHGCVVEAKYPTYLGRPWKPFSRVVVMESYLGAGVQARGWLEWAAWDRAGLATLFYGEYRNYGPGAGVAGRVRWPGYHVIMDAAVASSFTVRRFISGLAWLPGTGVTFTADLFRKT
ncbi:putative pectinesterase/pectinesterase inhibitor 22 [Phragmites australis]|uniref:putative pectinesterase/pectinesterase inhibitor 22 n=1 Tax=Phragmites australis TaxID=29695 RepID=UPI002D767AA7|nr:putative pectinesterase/pectinesterase inhibitor 22 [Phragmites australis]